jgi:hypothetical protein
MAVFLSLLLALALVAGIVFMLRQYQARAIEENADRHTPLPPIDDNTREQALLDNEALAQEQPLTSGPATSVPASPPKDWQKLCQKLKAEGRLDDALVLVSKVYPQWSAYEQQAVIIRMLIRERKKHGGDIKPLAKALYRTAAQASCLHDRYEGTPAPGSPAKLAKLMPRKTLETLDMPYQQIGYEHLRLLTKSDRRMLADMWGEPATHVSARVFHANAFQSAAK